MTLSPCPDSDTPSRQRYAMATLLTLLLLQPLASGCSKQVGSPRPDAATAALRQGEMQGHAATVRCLRGERSLTDGDELRCEAWAYVMNNYRAATNPSPAR